MRSLSDLPLLPELQLGLFEPSGQPRERRGAALHALGGPAAVLKSAEAEDDAWDPSADEETGGFDIHLGVYASD